MNRFLCSLIVLLPTLSCGREDEPPKPSSPAIEPVPEVSFPSLEEPDLLPLPTPEDPTPLRWRFAPGFQLRWTFDQETHILERSGAGRHLRSDSGGVMALTVSSPGTAAIHVAIFPKGGEKLDPEKIRRLSYSVEEDGSLHPTSEETVRDAGLEVDLLFALPTRALAPGEKETRTIDVRGGPDTFAQTGTLTLTGGKAEKVGRYECRRLDSEIDLTLAATPDGRRKGGGRMRGRIRSWFAPEEGFFARIDSTARISVRGFLETVREGRTEFAPLNADVETTVRIRKKETP